MAPPPNYFASRKSASGAQTAHHRQQRRNTTFAGGNYQSANVGRISGAQQQELQQIKTPTTPIKESDSKSKISDRQYQSAFRPSKRALNAYKQF